MKPDSFTKSLLGAIAIALLVIAMTPWLQPFVVLHIAWFASSG